MRCRSHDGKRSGKWKLFQIQPEVATYGTLDNEECIEESKGTVMMTGENTYEYSENQ